MQVDIMWTRVAIIRVLIVTALTGCSGDGPRIPLEDQQPGKHEDGAPAGESSGGDVAPVDAVEVGVSTPAAAHPTSAAAADATSRAASRLPTVASTWGVQGIEPGQMMLPVGLAGDGQGYLYVSDSTGVAKYTLAGEFVFKLSLIHI
jgi:hypothetical protein